MLEIPIYGANVDLGRKNATIKNWQDKGEMKLEIIPQKTTLLKVGDPLHLLVIYCWRTTSQGQQVLSRLTCAPKLRIFCQNLKFFNHQQYQYVHKHYHIFHIRPTQKCFVRTRVHLPEIGKHLFMLIFQKSTANIFAGHISSGVSKNNIQTIWGWGEGL